MKIRARHARSIRRGITYAKLKLTLFYIFLSYVDTARESGDELSAKYWYRQADDMYNKIENHNTYGDTLEMDAYENYLSKYHDRCRDRFLDN